MKPDSVGKHLMPISYWIVYDHILGQDCYFMQLQVLRLLRPLIQVREVSVLFSSMRLKLQKTLAALFQY